MTLSEFADQWLSCGILSPPVSAYEKAGDNVGVTLYRDAKFQVQLWALPPNSVVTDHAHPDVNALLVRVAGKLRLRLNGRFIPLSEMQRTSWMGMRTWRHPVRPNDLHGVDVGSPGGSFLTISERTDGRPPSSVHRNWTGAPLDLAHSNELDTV